MKILRLAERQSVQLRLESFSVTNTPAFGRPDASFGGSSFGIISGYATGCGARQSQVAIKFYY